MGESRWWCVERSTRARHFRLPDETRRTPEEGRCMLPHLAPPTPPRPTCLPSFTELHRFPLVNPFICLFSFKLQFSLYSAPASFLSSPCAKIACSPDFLCNDPVLWAKENKKANKAKALDAANAILNASLYNDRTAISSSGERSRMANRDLRSFSTSYSMS